MALPQEVQQTFLALVNSGNIVYTVYPTAATPLVDVTGIALTADAAGSKLGGTVEIIAGAGGIATAFWVCGIMVNTASAADQFLVRLASGAGDGVAFADFGPMDLTAVTANIPPIHLPHPVRFAALTRIAGRVACLDAVARTLNVSVLVATGIGT